MLRRCSALALSLLAVVAFAGCQELGIDASAPTATPTLTAVGVESRGPLVERGGGFYLEDTEGLPVVAVELIIDGDTIAVRAGSSSYTVRLFGVAAPERDEQCYDEATEELRVLAGTEVAVLADRRVQDRFDRELRYLFTPDGRSIDADLVRAGVAEAWRDDGSLRDQLVGLERAAQAAGRGCLWAAQ